MRIVSFNTHHGLTPSGTVDTDLLARYCASFSADVLALQEIDVLARRSGGADQARAVAAATGLQPFFGPARRMGLRGRYGNSLLVRGTIEDARVVPLPRAGRHEGRTAILARVVVGDDRPLSVAATHLSVFPDEAASQLDAVLAALAAWPLPRLMLGDLNLRPEQVGPALASRLYALASAGVPTFPAGDPRLRIDHFISEGLEVTSVEVLDAGPVSDHRALVVEVR